MRFDIDLGSGVAGMRVQSENERLKAEIGCLKAEIACLKASLERQERVTHAVALGFLSPALFDAMDGEDGINGDAAAVVVGVDEFLKRRGASE